MASAFELIMKLDFPIPTDGKMHRFCIGCRTEGAIPVERDGITRYHCPVCGLTNDRAIYFNEHKAWLDDNKTLWHESSVMFVKNPKGKFLFYTRTKFPFVLTVPVGHVDRGETGAEAATREIKEEVGIVATSLRHIARFDIPNDKCGAGADIHHVHAFSTKSSETEIEVAEEGKNPEWLSLEEAKARGLAYAIEFFIERCQKELDAA
jgi:8-oxo-dGTP pyrophosphatase MutT (NUDIX family)